MNKKEKIILEEESSLAKDQNLQDDSTISEDGEQNYGSITGCGGGIGC